MDLVNITKLGSLLRASITDYTILNEKMLEVIELCKELENNPGVDHREISKAYLKTIESYLITNSILRTGYDNLQKFAIAIKESGASRPPEISKSQLDLMRLDIEHSKNLPALRDAMEKIHDKLISSEVIRDETLRMIGVVKDGRLNV